jgi:hypothetical protein
MGAINDKINQKVWFLIEKLISETVTGIAIPRF